MSLYAPLIPTEEQELKVHENKNSATTADLLSENQLGHYCNTSMLPLS
jgi:hypothetical protein